MAADKRELDKMVAKTKMNVWQHLSDMDSDNSYANRKFDKFVRYDAFWNVYERIEIEDECLTVIIDAKLKYSEDNNLDKLREFASGFNENFKECVIVVSEDNNIYFKTMQRIVDIAISVETISAMEQDLVKMFGFLYDSFSDVALGKEVDMESVIAGIYQDDIYNIADEIAEKHNDMDLDNVVEIKDFLDGDVELEEFELAILKKLPMEFDLNEVKERKRKYYKDVEKLLGCRKMNWLDFMKEDSDFPGLSEYEMNLLLEDE